MKPTHFSRYLKFALFLAILCSFTNVYAYDFEVDGIYYTKVGSRAYVTFQSYVNGNCTSDYSGDVVIPPTVTYSGTTYTVNEIGWGAFSGCTGLTSITIPSSIITVGDAAFKNCSSLTGVYINDLEAWCNTSFANNNSNPLYNAHHLFLNGVEVKDLVIPNTITAINKNLFCGCSGLTSVTIPNSVTGVGESSFSGCTGLNSVSMSNSVTSIGNYAFYGCTGLTDVAISSAVTTIGYSAFHGCTELTHFTIPNSITEIGTTAFYGCTKLKSLIWNAVNCASIGGSAFNFSINNLQFGNAVEHIPAGLPSLSMSGKTLVLPNSVKTIATGAFKGTCAAVVIGNNIQNIATGAFPNGISVAYVTSTVPRPCEAGAFSNPQNLFVPAGSLASYTTAQGWSEFINIYDDEDEYVPATSISLNKSSIVMSPGSTQQLTATISPSNASATLITWQSMNTAVATVNSNGKITAQDIGETDIVAMVDNVYAICHVTVNILPNNVFSMPDTTVSRGETVVIPVTMTNQDEITAFQTDIYLPEGFEIVKENGDYVVELSNRRSNTHIIMANVSPEGFVRILSYSSSLKPFSGNDGVLFYVTVKAPEEGDGVYPIELRDTRLTTTAGNELIIPDAACNVTIEPYLLGDANNSGDVTITDVVVTARHILFYNPQPFVFGAADVNHDGQITVSDAVNIAYMVLNGTLMGSPSRLPALAINDCMSGTSLWASANFGMVSVLLDNVADYTAFQFDLHLPEGMMASNFRLTDCAGSHTLGTAISDDGSTRVLCYSPSLQAISGSEGAVLTFDVTNESGITRGDILADGIELVTTSGETVKLTPFSIALNEASGVSGATTSRTVTGVDYYNIAGQRVDRIGSGVTIVVTTYSDGTRTVTKVFR